MSVAVTNPLHAFDAYGSEGKGNAWERKGRGEREKRKGVGK